MAPPQDNPGVLAPPPLFFVVPLLAGLALSWLVPLPLGPLWPRVVVGGLLVAGCVALIAWAVTTMRRHGTDFLPTRPSTAIVSTGPFARTRNPMYVAMALGHAGLAVLLGSGWALLMLPVALALVRHGAIAQEERYLERKFGDAYLAYKRRVRRWV